MENPSSKVADLVTLLHTNIDSIHACINSLSDTSTHDAELTRLEEERENKIAELRRQHDEAVKALADQRQKEAEELEAKRKKEAEDLEEQRRKEWEELMARRKREDEERKARLEAEEAEMERVKKEEDERREREKEENERTLQEKVEAELEKLEDEMEAKIEEGKKALRDLDEKRKAINAQIDAALNTPTVIPEIKFRSRAKTLSRARADTVIDQGQRDTGAAKEAPANIAGPESKAKGVSTMSEPKPTEAVPAEQKEQPSAESEANLVEVPEAKLVEESKEIPAEEIQKPEEIAANATLEESAPKEDGNSTEPEAKSVEAAESEAKEVPAEGVKHDDLPTNATTDAQTQDKEIAAEPETKSAEVSKDEKHDEVPPNAKSDSEPQVKETSAESKPSFTKADDIPTETKKDVESEDHHEAPKEDTVADSAHQDASAAEESVTLNEAKEEKVEPQLAHSPVAQDTQAEQGEEHAQDSFEPVVKVEPEHVEESITSKEVEAASLPSDALGNTHPSVQADEHHEVATPVAAPSSQDFKKLGKPATEQKISPEPKGEAPTKQHDEHANDTNVHNALLQDTNTNEHIERPEEPFEEPEISHQEDEHAPGDQHMEQTNGTDNSGIHQDEGEAGHEDFTEPLNSATIHDALLEDRSLQPLDDDEPHEHPGSQEDDIHDSERDLDQNDHEDEGQTNHFHEALKSEFKDFSLRTPTPSVNENTDPMEDVKESEATVAQPDVSQHESGADASAVSGNELPNVQSDRGADTDVRNDAGQSVSEGEHEAEVTERKSVEEPSSHTLDDPSMEGHHEPSAEQPSEPDHQKEEPQQVLATVEPEPSHKQTDLPSADTITADANGPEEAEKHDHSSNKEHEYEDDPRVTPSEVRQAYFDSGTKGSSPSSDPVPSEPSHISEETLSNETQVKHVEELDKSKEHNHAAGGPHVEATPEPEIHEEPAADVKESLAAPLSLFMGQDISRMGTPEPPREGLGEASSTLAVAPETPTSGHFSPNAEFVESAKDEEANDRAEHGASDIIPALNIPAHSTDSDSQDIPSSQDQARSSSEPPAPHQAEDHQHEEEHLGEPLVDDHDISHLDLDHGPQSRTGEQAPNHENLPTDSSNEAPEQGTSNAVAPSAQGQERNISADATPMETPLSTSDEFFTPMIGGTQETETSQYPLPDQSRSQEPTPTFPKERAVGEDEQLKTLSDEGVPQTTGSMPHPEPVQHDGPELSVDPVSHTVVPKHIIEALDDAGVKGATNYHAQSENPPAEDSNAEDSHVEDPRLEETHPSGTTHDHQSLEKELHFHQPLDTSATFADHQDTSQPMTAASSRADTFVSAEEGQDSDYEHDHDNSRNWPLPTNTPISREPGVEEANQPAIHTNDFQPSSSNHESHEKPMPSPLGLGAATMHHSKAVDREDSPGPQPAVDPTHEDKHQQAINNVATQPGFTPSERSEPEFEQFAERPKTPIQATRFADQPRTPVQMHPHFSEHHVESPVTVLNADDLFDDDSDDDEDSGDSFPLEQYQDVSPAKSSEAKPSEPEHESQSDDIADQYFEDAALDPVPEHTPIHRFSESPHRNSGLFANLVDTIRPDMGLVRHMSDHQAEEEQEDFQGSNRPVSVSFDESAGAYDYVARDNSLHVRTHTADTVPSFESYAHSDTPTSPSEAASSPFQETPHDEPRIQSSWQEDAPVHDEHQDLKPQASPLQVDFDPFNSKANPNYVTPKTSQANLRETEHDPYGYSGGVDAPKLPVKDVRRSSPATSPLARQFPASPSPSRRQFPSSPSRSPGLPTLNTSSASQFSEGRPYDSPPSRTNSMHEEQPSEHTSSSPFPSPSSLARRTTGPSPPKIASNRTPVSSPSIPSSSFFQKTRSLFESASASPAPTPSPPPPRPLSGFFSVGRSTPPPPPRKTSRPSSLYQSESATAEYNEEEDSEFIVRNLDGDGKPPSPVFIPTSSPARSSPNSHTVSRSGSISSLRKSISRDEDEGGNGISKRASNPFLGGLSRLVGAGSGGLEDSIHNPERQVLLGKEGRAEQQQR